ncbi:MAG: ATPase, T2SS/T4P/T4SS family [Paraperlucidibaca sp.]
MNQHPAIALPRQDDDVVPWLSTLLRQAVSLGASDLHIDAMADGAQLRLRIHGLLHDWQHIPAQWQGRLISRIKVLASLDLAERRLPQDGRLSLPDIGSLRVASLPTLHGEKLCLRLCEGGALRTVAELSLPSNIGNSLDHALHCPDGLILITGPTGSGKTTTLYACLQALNSRERHIATVEDPIEHTMAGINQTAITPRIGLGFAEILRALLRHDPDVIMVGEIRDKATADMAMQAAETGHLVLSTLHTGSALESLTRLRHLGVPDYLVSSSLRLVISQRLVRRRCVSCAPLSRFGCTHCIDGYQGRLGLYEALALTPEVVNAWASGADQQALSALLATQQWRSMREHAAECIALGLTEAGEVERVLGRETCHH